MAAEPLGATFSVHPRRRIDAFETFRTESEDNTMITAETMDTPSSSESGFRLKGWHVLVITVAFFAASFTVDIGMAVMGSENLSAYKLKSLLRTGSPLDKEMAKAEAAERPPLDCDGKRHARCKWRGDAEE